MRKNQQDYKQSSNKLGSLGDAFRGLDLGGLKISSSPTNLGKSTNIGSELGTISIAHGGKPSAFVGGDDMNFSTFDYGRYVEEKINSQVMSTIPCLTLVNTVYRSPRLNKLTEIDVLVLGRHAIYSLECKGYTGALSGDINNRMWIGQSSNRSTRIFNPVMQNYMHIRSLRNFLYRKFERWYTIYGYVVLLDDTKLAVNTREVVHVGELIRIIKRDYEAMPAIYDVDMECYRIKAAIKDSFAQGKDGE